MEIIGLSYINLNIIIFFNKKIRIIMKGTKKYPVVPNLSQVWNFAKKIIEFVRFSITVRNFD
jgi:hypothetical protein